MHIQADFVLIGGRNHGLDFYAWCADLSETARSAPANRSF